MTHALPFLSIFLSEPPNSLVMKSDYEMLDHFHIKLVAFEQYIASN